MTPSRVQAHRGGLLLAAAPLTFLAVFFLWPIAVTMRRAFWGDGLTAEGAGLSAGAIARAAATTVGLAAGGTAVALLVGLPAVWALYRHPWKGASTVAGLLSAPFVLPTMVVALGVLALQREVLPGLDAFGGVPAIVAALAFFNVAVVLRFVGPQLAGLDERRVSAARVLGASGARVVAHVVWPHVRRSVGNAAAVTFLFCATSFAIVLVLGGTRVRTLETSAYLEVFTFANVEGAATLALVQAVVVGATAFAVSRLGTATRPGVPGLSIRAPRRSFPLIGLLLTPAIVLVAFTLMALVVQALRGPAGWTLDNFGAVFSLEPAGPGLPALGAAALRSIGLAIVATAIVMTLSVLTLSAGRLRPRLRWIRAFSMAPLAVSSVVVGLGLLLGPALAFRGHGSLASLALIVVAQVLIALPLVVRLLGSALDELDGNLLAAARTLGADGWRLTRTVIAPLLRPALAATLGIAFAISIGEFGATVFLARPAEPTLPTAIARLLGRPGPHSIGLAMAAAVVLGTVAAGAMMLSDRWGSRRTRLSR